MKRVTTFFLALLCLLTFSAAPCSAFAEEAVVLPVLPANPFYEGRAFEEASLDEDAESAPETVDGTVYYPAEHTLFTVVRDKLLQRKTAFTLGYISTYRLSTTYRLRQALDVIFAGATDDAIARGCKDGDYLRWGVSVFGATGLELKKSAGAKYYYTIDFSISFYATAKQEQAVDKAIYQFTQSLPTDKMSDYRIIRRVHDYICSCTTYDDEAAANPSAHPDAFTAYGALIGGKAVCQGYAAAFQRICKELGYNARFVSSDPNSGRHAWNLVALGGKYYYVDCTWDDQIADGKMSGSRDAFFLVNESRIRGSDSDYEEHLLDDKYYDDAYFNTNYRSLTDAKVYNSSDSKRLSNCIVSIAYSRYPYTGKAVRPAVSVKTADGKTLVNGKDYQVVYSDNLRTGYAKVSVKGKGSYTASSHRTFLIVPKKMGALKAKSIAKTAVTLCWSKAGGCVDGYIVQQKKGGKWVTVKTVAAGKTSVKITGLSASRQYSFRIRAYKTVSGIRHCGGYSKALTVKTKAK